MKCWYRDAPLELLATHFNSSPDARQAAYAHVDRIARLSGKSKEDCLATSKKAEVESPPPNDDELDEHTERQRAWDELVCILEQLEKEHGWREDVEGTEAYTSDGKALGDVKSSMLLGEGWRKF